jgi:hypothetical protein
VIPVKTFSDQRQYWTTHYRMQTEFNIEIEKDPHKRCMKVTALPLSFDWKLKFVFLAHFYSRKYEIKLESGNEPHPL